MNFELKTAHFTV